MSTIMTEIAHHAEERASVDRASDILRRVLEAGQASVEELAASLAVSTSTIRRDLAELEREGLLRRTHGGAASMSPMLYEPFRYDSSFKEQETERAEEKRRIGLAAADLVDEGDTIGLTAGTTATEVARSLRHRKGITIVTNTVNVAMELSDRSGLNVFVTGGFLRGGWFSLVGPASIAAVQQIFLDKVFIGVNAIDAEQGLTCYHPDEAATNRAIIQQAKRKIVVADSTKLGRVVTSKICPTEGLSALITDRGATDADIAPFLAKGIEVRRV
jgi:DeoR family transcriptional regulator of aga operon